MKASSLEALASEGAAVISYSWLMTTLSVRAQVLLALLAGLAPAALARGVEQTVTPIVPRVEQRIEAVTPSGIVQEVRPVDTQQMQTVSEPEPLSASAEAASTAAKIGTGILAVAISVGFTIASLLFF